MWTPNDLLAFEESIAAEFAAGNIKSPIHLSGGNESRLIEIFKSIGPADWVLSGWRSHYHALLRGVPPDKLKAAILDGRSVSLCFPEQKVLCSGICGGVAPIAVGLGWSLKRKNDEDYTGNQQFVHVFVGDMAREMGIVHEAIKYAARHLLPVEWYVEDNGVSVATDTQKSWGPAVEHVEYPKRVHRYRYDLTRPHSGIGRWVKFANDLR